MGWRGEKSYWLGRRGDGRTERSAAIGDGGQAALSLSFDIDGTSSQLLADSILSILLKKWSSNVWVVEALFLVMDDEKHWTAFWMGATNSGAVPHLGPVIQQLTVPSRKSPSVSPASCISLVLQLLLLLVVSLHPFLRASSSIGSSLVSLTLHREVALLQI